MKIYRDLKNVLDSSFEQGFEQCELMIIKKYSINFFKNGVPVNIIAYSLEVSQAEVLKNLKDARLIPENGSH